MTDQYDRETFHKRWAEQVLKCPNTPFDIAAALVTKYRNFQTAVAVLFGLSVKDHREWVLACAEHWRANFPKGSVADYNYCVQFQQYYITEVAKYPEGA